MTDTENYGGPVRHASCLFWLLVLLANKTRHAFHWLINYSLVLATLKMLVTGTISLLLIEIKTDIRLQHWKCCK